MVLPIIAAGVGGLLAANATNKAAKTQAKAAGQAADAQERMSDRQIDLARQTQQDIRNNLQPYRQAGMASLGRQNQELAGGFQYEAAPGMNDAPPQFQFSSPSASEFRADPGYQFAFDEGMRAIEGSAASRGNLFSGATLKALNRYGTGMADQQYRNFLGDYRQQEANALNDFRTQQANTANDYRSQQSIYRSRLDNAVASGQNAAAQANNAATNSAAMQGNALMNSGNAQAAGYMQAGNARAAGSVGFANALNGGINNALGAYQYMQQTASPALPQAGQFSSGSIY